MVFHLSLYPFLIKLTEWPKRQPSGCSSVVERHVANVAVVGSSPITRSERRGGPGRCSFSREKEAALGFPGISILYWIKDHDRV